MITPNKPTSDKIEKIFARARQECISEVIFYLHNDIAYDEEHITCMLVYHIVGKIPRYSCGSCIEKRCLLPCFRMKLSNYIEALPNVEIEQSFPTLHVSGENVSFRFWTMYGTPETDSKFIYRNISMDICLPGSQPQRILYDEYKLSPEAIPIIDKYMPKIRQTVPEIISRALSAFEKREQKKRLNSIHK